MLCITKFCKAIQNINEQLVRAIYCQRDHVRQSFRSWPSSRGWSTGRDSLSLSSRRWLWSRRGLSAEFWCHRKASAEVQVRLPDGTMKWFTFWNQISPHIQENVCWIQLQKIFQNSWGCGDVGINVIKIPEIKTSDWASSNIWRKNINMWGISAQFLFHSWNGATLRFTSRKRCTCSETTANGWNDTRIQMLLSLKTLKHAYLVANIGA